ncbi:ABC transporter ATP-binding protein [Acidovorax sp. Leaf76]|uniref:ABC transporter ATP-binding protein n=1 Tax=unclassified Acidovorax TaxID=2684926 RepID=UPI00070204CC|nr:MULTISPECIES: ABC transporter ATP-binding protein [unclassified Acidovorax]KQO24258.1 ABC transporter ATP-binding protein [Acidovorax sp. Leaf76]KQO37134.1 ABC transporter ATP-binding protein [Acidovorax sp. Leaf84]KQS29144.1 ABC transporter ATP-binding protein [Acidovorax sp. Leaf191]
MPENPNPPCLDVRGLTGHYGETQALHGIDFVVQPGEVVCLLGRNGAGKTTTLRAIVGLLTRRQGHIAVNGRSTQGMVPEDIAHLGVAYCPEERGIFASLDVEENLLLPPVLMPGGMSVEDIYTLFPNLKLRRRSPGTRLSGGEQQMLAIGRILRTGAKLLLLDECTEGLAPVIIDKIGEAIATLRQRGFTILMVEQNFRFASGVGDRFYVIEEGRVVEHFDRQAIVEDRPRIEALLGV